ncbi:hypothetical protein [Methanobrevibacter wolinii]|uniref:hypothetical protein n=1 Tax=Methanobrevibacter wolinii TaxID=190977 RepID=UPI0005B2CB5A|nr:hypothetical protein [Methanobrevibacter wolinii]
MAKYLSENEVQDLVNHNEIVQEGIKSLLGINEDVTFIPEDKYINGITADFTVIQGKTIKAIIECKAGNINLTDYVRGIGQLFQYEYFFEKNVAHKSFKYDDNNFKTIYFFPSSVIKNNKFNISRFKYPETTVIYELNEHNYAIRRINKNDLKKLENKNEDNLVTISQYYFRDNRIFEYYILIKFLLLQEEIGLTEVDRIKSEVFLIKTNTINNGNWRNAFITISNLGLTNKNNLLTEAGKKLAINNYESFAVKMYHSYVEPYFEEIIKCFKNNKEVNLSNHEFINIIRKNHKNRDVLYLTESDGRYISSWLNIMRDDYGIISFEPRKKIRKLNYNPHELKDEIIEEKIKKFSIAYVYINNYQKLLRKRFEGGI